MTLHGALPGFQISPVHGALGLKRGPWPRGPGLRCGAAATARAPGCWRQALPCRRKKGINYRTMDVLNKLEEQSPPRPDGGRGK